MPRWKALPEELDPQVREFASQLRRLVDRSGLSIAALADRTGYSKTSWERYLNGRLLAPKGAIVALAEVTGTNPMHLTTMWELAERAWSRSEMRHDMTMEAIRISQARAALGEFGPATQAPSATSAASGPSAPSKGKAQASAPPPGAGAATATPAGPYAPQPGPSSRPPHQTPPPKRKGAAVLLGVLLVLGVIAGALYFTGFGFGGGEPVAKPSPSPTKSEQKLPDGVKCVGADCTGEDPERMACSGELALTSTSVTVGTALVEVRYSETCGAAWARITQAAPGDTVRISGTAGSDDQRGEVDGDGDAYTPMVAVKNATEARACATLTTGTKGCTPPTNS
ncbi:XRE family transcriptional regulator [Streptomyces sp. Da 82-17]|uniref:XRE family transcriptional regulator n=1 Tax=Streptomyces sp. Da 82-17 TaxID=3377116 RepID=UPI0038D3D17E